MSYHDALVPQLLGRQRASESQANELAQSWNEMVHTGQELVKTRLTSAALSTQLILDGIQQTRSARTLSDKPNSQYDRSFDIDGACQTIVQHFDELADSVAQLTSNLHEMHRATLQLEDDIKNITLLCNETHDIMQREISSKLSEIQQVTEAVAKYTSEWTRALESERNSRANQAIYAEAQYREQKKARRRWAKTVLTGGMALPFAIHSEWKKRDFRSSSQGAAFLARYYEAQATEQCRQRDLSHEQLKKLKESQSTLVVAESQVKKAEDRNRLLRNEIAHRLEGYIHLKEMALTASSKVKRMQANAGVLKYAESIDELYLVADGIRNTLQEPGVKHALVWDN